MKEAIKYVVGFMFSENGDEVILIKKKRPSWQLGLLNGVGGKLEPGERPCDAMVREFQEEAGIQTKQKDWMLFAQLQGEGFLVYCLKSFNQNAYIMSRTCTDEELIKTVTRWIPQLVAVTNVPWLIQLAKDFDMGNNGYAQIAYAPPWRSGDTCDELPDEQQHLCGKV